ncbi:MAG: LysR family transcriptional regulator [Burkholderiales bacterium]|nr:LysR family transcriptional regulator [Burkholderiales bacterium]
MPNASSTAHRPDTRFPSIDALRAFEAAARLGSFEQVASELAITASAVSKRITALEQLIGTTLFSRAGRRPVLTAAGKEYVEQVRAALHQLAAVGLHQRAAQSVPRLRVLSTPTFAREVLVPRLKPFADRHADAEIEIVVAIPYLDIATPDADVAITFGPRHVPVGGAVAHRVHAEPLLFEPVFAVAAPSLLKSLRIRRPHDLLRATGNLRVPLLRCPLEPWSPWFAAAGLDAVEPTRGVKLVDLGLALEAAASGQGVTLARRSLAERWMARGELVAPFDVQSAPRDGYHLSVQQASALALDFAQWLRTECALLETRSAST